MSGAMFRKVLIANRGEIACRVMRTCRRLGIATVAVYSDADAASLHVRMADEAVRLGPAPAKESYLAIDRILDAAKRTGAEAIHPGYGFLSENEEFAEACAQAGVTFIGPPASAIRAMGSKSAAKALMQKAGVPLTPGYHGEVQDADFLRGQADAIGYPVLIKASAGGGGKGMRRVEAAGEFAAALESCRREAAASFGDDRVLIERYVLQPRHIEIQVFSDTQGDAVSLFERDCSVQRRHQKVLEEAPAPGMTAERRAAMGKAACDAARAVGYVGAGTVEFIADAEGNFHFMEMNTRLQVEHPVTEKITGLDLVEWQLRVAAGEPLPLRQEQLRIAGHAIEARIYAEDAAHGFRPSTGRLVYMRTPVATEHVRIDTGVEQGDEITAFYDPMIAKLIVWEETRALALRSMEQALREFEVVGVTTNVEFLQRLVGTPSFAEARLDTALIEREQERLRVPDTAAPAEGLVLASLGLMLGPQVEGEGDGSPWELRDGWRLNGALQRTLRFQHGKALIDVEVRYEAGAYAMRVHDERFAVRGQWVASGLLRATMNGLERRASVVEHHDVWHVFLEGREWAFKWLDPLATEAAESAQEGSLRAPIPGRVTALVAQPGVAVEKGAPLLVLEAMKMEYTIEAPAAGRVQAFLFAVGDQVAEGTQLVQFERGADAGQAPEGAQGS
jgi:3-methylcrotonyl-CoA carboxylase alpha subunit